MPKPTQDQLYGVYTRWLATNGTTTVNLVDDLNRFWSDAWEATTSEFEQLEQHNREQRISREAYAEALKAAGYVSADERSRNAASRYPLRKRVAKVITDPHGDGEWSAAASELFWRSPGCEAWRDPPVGLTASRVRALSALLDDPWEVRECTEPEEEEAR